MTANCKQIHEAFKKIIGDYRVFTLEDYKKVRKEFCQLDISGGIDKVKDTFLRYD